MSTAVLPKITKFCGYAQKRSNMNACYKHVPLACSPYGNFEAELFFVELTVKVDGKCYTLCFKKRAKFGDLYLQGVYQNTYKYHVHV